jgi:hypothetical protein
LSRGFGGLSGGLRSPAHGTQREHGPHELDERGTRSYRHAFAIAEVEVPGSIEAARISEVGTSPHWAADLLASEQPVRRGRLAEAIAFLERELTEGPKPARELTERARQLGITEQTLKRARTQLGVGSRKPDFGGGWAWALPVPEADTQAA